MNIFFGTDGWRALLDSEINIHSVSIVAQAFADFINSNNTQNKVAIAYDTRRNSNIFAKRFAEVLSGNNIQVLLSDQIVPTPTLSLATQTQGCVAGVMITASHNPPTYNGIKFKSNLGGPFSTEATKKVEAFLHKNPIKSSTELISEVDMLTPYFNHINDRIDFKTIQKANLNILIDSMGGAGKTFLQQLLETQNIKCKTIFGEASETFNGRLAEPIEQNLSPLIDALKQGNFSLGVATDGDADRVGVCLDNGEWLSAQNTILLLTDYVINVKNLAGGIIKTSSVSDKIRHCFAHNRTVHEVQVGFKYIADIMTTETIAFGGEESGGFGFGTHLPERDGIFSALMLIEMLAKSKFSTLSDYLVDKQKQFGEIFYDRIDMHYDKADKNDLLPWLNNNLPTTIGPFAITNTLNYCSSRNIVNGIKLIGQDHCRWLLIRSSETENIIRLYAEGQSNGEVKTLLQLGVKLLHNTSDSIQDEKK